MQQYLSYQKKEWEAKAMENDRTEHNGNHSCIGVIAHVDAGKTTLAESILYLTGGIRRLGRVDHRDTFLDTHALERERGITIFAKQAEVVLREGEQELLVTLLDTPGHVDFSAETERTLQVLDYAILVISGTDGVQGHVMTLWTLLAKYHIPVFLFINKMDQPDTNREKLLSELQERLDERCVAFELRQTDTLIQEAQRLQEAQKLQETQRLQKPQEFLEQLALCGEDLMEEYLSTQTISEESIRRAIHEREVFPCFFGSALKLTGVQELLCGLLSYCRQQQYPSEFGARVFKIARDLQGNRLTYMKITGGSLKVKESLLEEKCDQLRIYSGGQYRLANEVYAGEICAVTGPERTFAGQGLGIEGDNVQPVLAPVLTYQILLPPRCDTAMAYKKLSRLEEEEPLLHLVWEEETGELHAQVMGEIQMEILKELSKERFDLEISFGAGSIVYKETIEEQVEGIGHFEPLRHYAEVHVLLTPLARGAGLIFDTELSEDVLDRNWQRLVLTHLEEREHRGVLCGAPVTDLRITLVAGRAHKKHTEGGDFREATYRAVRQGLKCAKSVLLEPIYEFRLEVPMETVGRAMSDLERMYAEFAPPEMQGGRAVLVGSAPVSAMREYPKEVAAYTRGEGRMSCSVKGYAPCHNAEEIITDRGYDPEADVLRPTGSVFCSHGAGFFVEWNKVHEYMHIESVLEKNKKKEDALRQETKDPAALSDRGSGYHALTSPAEEAELAEIFHRTYGKREKGIKGVGAREEKKAAYHTFEPAARLPRRPTGQEKGTVPVQPVEEYLLVDGYNIIFAWEELKELAATNLAAARLKLMDVLCNYQGYKKCKVILVFDAYKVEGFQGEVQRFHNIYVVYTKEAETADQYIEKTVHEIGRKYHVTVATSDATEQVIIWGAGAYRMSARGLLEEISHTNKEIRAYLKTAGSHAGERLLEQLPKEMATRLEQIRLGKEAEEEKKGLP